MSIKKFAFILISAIILTVGLYATALIILTWPISQLSIEKSGVFGDSFGLLTSLFSGLAFAGLIITILMQKEELALQRDELSLTRTELSGQKEELAIQNKTMMQQKFENTFFQLLSLHNEIVRAIDVTMGEREHRGRDAFQILHRKFINSTAGKAMKEASKDSIGTEYLKFYKGVQNEIGHYFRNLYTLVKFVNESSTENKRLYTNIIRAQLSNYELFFLFYNCLSEMGIEKFHPLIEKYGLLKTLPDDLILNSEHKKLYFASAYGNTEKMQEHHFINQVI